MDLLAAVTRKAAAAERLKAAAESLEQAIVRAHKEGRPITHIASMVGVSRQTIYDILDRRDAR